LKNMNNSDNRIWSWLRFVLLGGLFCVATIFQANAQDNTHTVKQGESLYSIARTYNVTIDQLKNWNELTSNTLAVGQELVISDPDKASVSYQVKPGDTLFSIAKEFGVSISEIKEWNNLSGNSLKIGQRLIIYRQKEQKLQGGALNKTIEDSGQSIIAKNEDSKTTYYQVKSGDTLYEIAREHNMSVAELKALNDLQSDRLSVGQRLTVKALETAPSVGAETDRSLEKGNFRRYRVQRGEDLPEILEKFKMDSTEFAALNAGISLNSINSGLRVTVLEPPQKVFANPYRVDSGINELGETTVDKYETGAVGQTITAGGLYNPNSLTAAHANISLGKVIYIENAQNGKGIYVLINDRITEEGIKLSEKAYNALEFSNDERAAVTIYQGQNQ